jgi:threonine/homoserine/homoserine lactone efflux protein
VAAVALGLGEFLEGGLAVRSLGLVGGGVLFWLAWQTYKDSLVPFLAGTDEAEVAGWQDLPWKGILTSLSNPYWFLWWATIGMAYMTIALKRGWTGVVLFYLGHILADLAWYSLVSGLVASGRRFLGERSYAWLLRACALMLVGFGAYFFLMGIRGSV